MKNRLFILITMVFAISPFASANQAFLDAVKGKRWKDALEILLNDPTFDANFVPAEGKNATLLVIEEGVGQQELLKLIWKKKKPDARHYPKDQMRKATPLEAKEVKANGLETDEMGTTFAHWACMDGNLALLKYFFDNAKPFAGLRAKLSNVIDIAGDSLLHYAILGGHLNVVEYVLDHGADIEGRNSHGETPLARAAALGNLQLVRLLIERGASVDATDFEQAAALHFAAWDGHDAIVAELLKACASPSLCSNLGTTPLLNAATNGHVGVVCALLDAGVDVNEANPHGVTALHNAAREGHLDVVMLLVERGANVNALTEDDISPLHNAAMGHLKVVKFLIEKRAELNQRSLWGDTPIHFAAADNHRFIVRLLRDSGAATDLLNDDGETPEDVTTLKGIRDDLNPMKGGKAPSASSKKPRGKTKTSKKRTERSASPSVESRPAIREVVAEAEAPQAFAEAPRPFKKAYLRDYVFEVEQAPELSNLPNPNQLAEYQAGLDRYLAENVRARTEIRNTDGGLEQVRVRATVRNGDCGLTVLDLTRQEFVTLVLQAWAQVDMNSDAGFVEAIFAEMRALNVNTIGDWAQAFLRYQDNGDAAVWLDERHLEILSYVYNYRILIYVIDPANPNRFIPLPGPGGEIYRGRDAAHAQVFHVAHVAVEPGAPLTHYERLMVAPAAAVVQEPARVDPAPVAVALLNLPAPAAPLANLPQAPHDAQGIQDAIIDAIRSMTPQAAALLYLGMQLGSMKK